MNEWKKANEWKKFKKEYYGKDCVEMYDGGYIDFNPASMEKVKNGKFKTYDEYLDVQMKSIGKGRKYFEMCYYNQYDIDLTGQIEHVNYEKNKVVFHRIMINGSYHDGICFLGKEDHVWMDLAPFGECKSGDCFRFRAEIGRYMKQKNGKMIDYDLREPEDIKKVEDYHVPTDEELVDQQIKQLVCETCRYYDHCYAMCIGNEKEIQHRFETLKSLEPGKFTPRTVFLAYELEYRFMRQMGGIRMPDKDSEDYPVMKRFLEICKKEPIRYTGKTIDALAKMLYPEKPRMYIE